MSETTLPYLPISTRKLVGWSRTTPIEGHVLSTPDVDQIAKAVALVADAEADKPAYLRRGVIARGLGRSYNESAQNTGGLTIDMTPLSAIHDIDAESAVVDVDAGVDLDTLMQAALPYGLWVPVLPGTRQVTIGGAIAHDIHGKNHHSQGSFGNHILEMTLLTADGRVLTLTPKGSSDDPDGELFWATVAGVGMTGIILRAKIQMKRTESAYFIADTERTGSLQETIDLHLQDGFEDGYEYASGWFDAISAPPKLGRGTFSRGNLATLDELPEKYRKDPLSFNNKPLISFPNIFPNGLANKFDFSLVGEAYWRAGPPSQGKVKNLAGFYHMLDVFGGWNNAYGRTGGFCQYQFIVPTGNEPEFIKLIEDIQASGNVSFLNVIKLFGDGNQAPLSFPFKGWNVCLDFPVKRGLAEFLNELDVRIMAMGGRLYTAKDSRTTAERFHAMYPQIDEWIATRRKIDPTGVFISDLGRRLELA
ncbi:decaprenylphosphoryl-beta-D-ribose oxidase [Tsukamurella pulmonis]|uniref:Decaprenylphospho-beta-D-ribofuranose 2-oxidase n=1 Tax=Tsukamurella pulmonis TaxID=47312 RepID=A0A1H1AWT4_9ACTN|nr:FAD-binding oxidoreductase [Tsukamurella pulmonis]KXO92832.1 decaprenylphosphoryl-beta-D-ribose oxidase [Tsukamurella pulmonis]BDD84733.1 decaprenylphosphoryl-beta-D-ribose oxidase [Tsukamurella pulmonis]SDQ44103.1 decaprenylphospho-beta-D-ribofuranose 2-oxidase [Tsukamurella pulmonis]SUP25990.1 Probable decaprenylphosphoryl-beta-D-ribose oxidase [Tsukamurella pulmonis]